MESSGKQENLYDVVADEIIKFCDKTYYGGVIFSLEQSYDGKDWDKVVDFASFENDDIDTIIFNYDWNEGQKHIRNFKVWHLEDSVPIIHGMWIEHHEPFSWMGYTTWTCSECDYEVGYEKDIKNRTDYCPNCGARMDGD